MATIIGRLGMLSAGLLSIAPAGASPFEDAARQIAQEHIMPLLSEPKLIDAVKMQNKTHADLTQAEIDALDQKWRAGDAALTGTVLGTDLSQHLAQVREGSSGMFTEIFVMDNKGLNVGQSDPTSDYWQGDEAKWQETYLKGPDAMHLSEVEEDESSQTFQVQISLPVVSDGAVIGALTAAVNAEFLE